MIKCKKLFFFAAALPFILLSCEDKKGGADAKFSYPSIVQKSDESSGGSIPLTIDQAVEIDGALSPDGNYFFYSSNRENGNYDIYLRTMEGVAAVRVTSHPSKDVSPSVSPDGSRIAFVSTREDPEGDIYVLKVKSKSLLKSAGESLGTTASLDSDAKNISQLVDPETKTILIVRDSNPAWSPDGNLIAFSSTRGDGENIWVMESSGKNLKKITSKGGVYPAFSPDGKTIAFVSYREKNSNGDIYTVDIEKSEEKRITSGPAIDLYPSYTSKNNEIVFSRIENDTNKNGSVDLNDLSRIYFLDTADRDFYPLTLAGTSSFAPRWYPGFQYGHKGGMIVYSEIEEGNINISMMPESGVIPARKTAGEQYDLALIYLTDGEDREKFFMASDKVYYSFKDKDDAESRAMISRSMIYAWGRSREFKDKPGAEKIFNRLKAYSKTAGFYPEAAFAYLAAAASAKPVIPVIQAELDKSLKNEKYSAYVPYLLEDLADLYKAEKNTEKSGSLYEKIIKEHAQYTRIASVKRKYAMAELSSDGTIPAVGIALLDDDKYPQRDSLKKDILRYFKKLKDVNAKISAVKKIRDKYPESKKIAPLMNLVHAQALYDSGDSKGASAILAPSLADSAQDKDYVYYLSSVMLGDILASEKKRTEANIHYYNAAVVYKKQWRDKNFSVMLKSLITYFEEIGERAHNSGKFNESTALYKQYSSLMSSISSLREYNDIYNSYSARSHILYITDYITLNGGKKLSALISDYEKNQITAQINFDKASIYALGYIYVMKGLAQEQKKKDDTGDKVGIKGLIYYMKKSVIQTDWAMFIDNTFVEPYVLKSWVYQYIDIKRIEDEDYDDVISEAFPRFLWEKNIPIIERALVLNDETKNAETEGTLHLNLGNNYFLLTNYPRAQYHYEESKKYKRSFGSRIEQAQFSYHLSQCYWQNGQTENSREELKKTLNIYESLAVGKNRGMYVHQLFTIYKYFALMYRNESNYTAAIAWYNKIIDFAAANGIDIDRARFLQEIAHCYMETGDFDRALANIDQSQKLLAKMPDDDRKYKLRFKLFETWSIPVYDLGPDSAVIGDNKIITGLDRKNKAILNYALLQEISERRNDYAKAVEYLNLKIKIHKKRGQDVDDEAIVIALNNLGYYNFILKKYPESAGYFKDARKTAIKNENLEGSFVAITNLTNLYSFAAENGITEIKDLQDEISSLLKDIEKYRDSYKSDKYKIEFEKLEKAAKAKSIPVTEEDKKLLVETIDTDAADIYFTVDISTGILNFYFAELSRDKQYKLSENPEDAVKLYDRSSDLYKYYSTAAEKFTAALESGNKKLEGSLKFKLMINLGVSLQNTGFYSEAAAAFREALETAAAYDNPKLLFSAYLNLGKNSFTAGDLTSAADYFSRGASAVDTAPPLFSVNIMKVRDLYDSYVKCLVKKGDLSAAFSAAERGRSIERIILFNVSGFSFAFESENRLYADYTGSIKKFETAVGRLTRLMDKKEPVDSDKYLSAVEEVEKSKAVLKSSSAAVGSSSRISSYVNPSSNAAVVSGSVIFMVLDNSKPYRILSNDGRNTLLKTADDLKGIEILLKNAVQEDRQSYLILDRRSVDLIKAGLIIPDSVFLTQSVSALNLFAGNRKPLPISLYSSVKGVASLLEGSGMSIVEAGKTTDVSGYPLVIDASGRSLLKKINIFSSDESSGALIEAADMFSSRKARQLLIVKNVEEFDYDFMLMYLEGASYSGVSSVGFVRKGKAEDFVYVVKHYLGKLSNSEKDAGAAKNIISINTGYPYRKVNVESSVKPLLNEERSAFTGSLAAGNFSEALISLNRWRDASLYLINLNAAGEKDAEAENKKFINALEYQYMIDTADIDILTEKFGDALDALEKAEKFAGDETSFIERIDIMKIYSFILKGEPDRAKKIIKKIRETESNPSAKKQVYADIQVFEAVIKCFDESPDSAAVLFNKISPDQTFAVDKSRLKILFTSAVRACGGSLSKINSKIIYGENFPMSVRERVVFVAAGGKADINYLSVRAKQIAGIKNIAAAQTVRDESARLLLNGTDYDSLSVHAVIAAVENLSAKNEYAAAESYVNNLSLSGISQKANWMDAALFYETITSLYSAADADDKSLAAAAAALEGMDKAGINSPCLLKNFFYKKGLAQLKTGGYKDALKSLSTGAEYLSAEGDPLYKNYQTALLFLEAVLEKSSAAAERLAKISEEKSFSPSERFTIRMIEAAEGVSTLIDKKSSSDEEITKADDLYSAAFAVYNSSSFSDLVLPEAVEFALDRYIKYSIVGERLERAVLMGDIKKYLAASRRIKSLREQIVFNPAAGQVYKAAPDSVVLVFMKIEKDLSVISISDGKFRSITIKDGFTELEKILDDYRNLLPRFEITAGISSRLAVMFNDIEPIIKDKKIIFISADNEIEDIPFEIIGSKELLDERFSLYYLSSTAGSYTADLGEIYGLSLYGSDNAKVFKSVEASALRSAGIKSAESGSVLHLHSAAVYDRLNRGITAGGAGLETILKNKTALHIPAVEFSLIGKNEFVSSAVKSGAKAVIVNDCAVHDINNAVFTASFYRSLRNSGEPVKSFDTAKEKLRKTKEYRHPAYWAGIRLYLN